MGDAQEADNDGFENAKAATRSRWNSYFADMPEFQVPAQEVQTALDQVAGDTLRPTLIGLGILYSVLALSHLFAGTLAPALIPIMTLLAAFSAAAMFGLRYFLDQREIPVHWYPNFSALMAALVWLNSIVHLFLSREPQQTTNLLLFLVGIGFLFLSHRWLIFFIVLTVISWLGAVWANPSPLWTHFGFALFSAGLLSYIVHEARLRTVCRLEGLRLWEVRQKANLAASLVENERSRQTLTTLMESVQTLGGTLDLDQALGMALDQLSRLVPYDGAAVLLIENSQLVIRAWRAPTAGAELSIPMQFPIGENRLLDGIFSTHHPVALADARAHPDWPEEMRSSQFRSWIGAPLIAEGEAVGMLTVYSRQPGVYGARESNWVGMFADYAAIALRNAALVTRTQKALDQIAFLYKTVRTLTSTLETDAVLQNLLDLLYSQFKSDAVSIAMLEPDGTLYFRMAAGRAAESIRGLRLPPGTGVVGWVARSGQPAWIADVQNDPRFYGGIDRNTGFETRTIYAMPIQIGEHVLAVLEMLNVEPTQVTEESRQLLMALASAASPAIQNARLFEQVQRTEERYQQLFRLNQDPMAILDEYGRIHELNQAVRALLPVDEAPAFQALYVLGLTQNQFNDLKKSLESRPVVSWESRITSREGRVHNLEIHLARLNAYAPGGAYQWLAHDITDRVALEEMREQLSQMIVHDLRNPLSSIMSSLEILRVGTEDDPISLMQEILPIAQNSARRMDQMINTILDTARLRAGENILTPAPFLVSELVEGATASMQFSLSLRRQHLTVEMQPDLPALVGDYDLLRRVLINLLDNAIKFSPVNSVIKLSVRVIGREFRFAVADAGPGIPEEEQGQIFELFVRGHQQGKVKGSGVGLAFCKLVVDAHGGRIWVDSKPDAGSVFTFILPVAGGM